MDSYPMRLRFVFRRSLLSELYPCLLYTSIPQAERVVSAGKGIGEKKNMKLVESLAKAAGAAIGSSRPVAETLKYLPLNRYVGWAYP